MTDNSLEQKILEIALSDPDAFDSDRVRDEGVAYVCDPLGYSDELDGLCKRWASAAPQTLP